MLNSTTRKLMGKNSLINKKVKNTIYTYFKVLIYAFSLWFVYKLFTIIRTFIDNKKTDAFITQLPKAVKIKQTAKGEPTKSKAQQKLNAETIYEALKYSALDDNKTIAYNTLMLMQNDADVIELTKAFGSRQEYLFGIPTGTKKQLQQFVQSNFNKNDVEDINKAYKRSKMTYQF